MTEKQPPLKKIAEEQKKHSSSTSEGAASPLTTCSDSTSINTASSEPHQAADKQ